MFALQEGRSRPPVACRQRSPTLPTSEMTMMSLSHASTRAALALVLASVSWSAGAAAKGPRSALDESKTTLALAEQKAVAASEAERSLIYTAGKGFGSDLAGQLAVGEQLV